MKQDLIVIDLERVKESLQHFTFMGDPDVAEVLKDLRLFSVKLNPEPDYKAMWKGIKRFISRKEDLPQGHWFWKDMMAELSKLQAKHTPQGDQPTGVKKEGK